MKCDESSYLSCMNQPVAPATGGARKHMLKQPFFTTGCGAEPRKKKILSVFKSQTTLFKAI